MLLSSPPFSCVRHNLDFAFVGNCVELEERTDSGGACEHYEEQNKESKKKFRQSKKRGDVKNEAWRSFTNSKNSSIHTTSFIDNFQEKNFYDAHLA